MLAIVGASGKLGFATLTALQDHELIPADQIVCTTSSQNGRTKLAPFEAAGVQIRSANWDNEASFESALQGCDRLFLISSSRIWKDFNEAPPRQGREADHFVALRAAVKAGIKHVYYTSLAFSHFTKSRVMVAHARTEVWLQFSGLPKGLNHTILREGIYSESWPLYLGQFKVPGDEREEIVVAGDGEVHWTSIRDLGLANALILSDPTETWKNVTVQLSQGMSHTLSEVAEMVSKARGKEVKLKVLPREEYERHYIEERGVDESFAKWWSKTYDALKEGECVVHDSTLEMLLDRKGVKPKPFKETIKGHAWNAPS